MHARSFAALVCLVVIGGCDRANPLAPPSDADPAFAAAATPSLAGVWEFRETVITIQPSELNGLIGANPSERPRTRVVCDVVGSLDLEQDGSAFFGSGSQSVTCNTPEGPADFVPPPFIFSPEFSVLNGTVTGHAIAFQVGEDCLNRGAVQGAGDRFAASGRCDPGIPGVKNHAVWQAWRP